MIGIAADLIKMVRVKYSTGVAEMMATALETLFAEVSTNLLPTKAQKETASNNSTLKIPPTEDLKTLTVVGHQICHEFQKLSLHAVTGNKNKTQISQHITKFHFNFHTR